MPPKRKAPQEPTSEDDGSDDTIPSMPIKDPSETDEDYAERVKIYATRIKEIGEKQKKASKKISNEKTRTAKKAKIDSEAKKKAQDGTPSKPMAEAKAMSAREKKQVSDKLSGCRFVGHAQAENSLPKVAGLLNCKDTNEVRALLFDTQSMKIFRKWFDHLKADFNADKKHSLNKEAFLNFVAKGDPGTVLSTNHRSTSLKREGTTRMHVSTAWHIRQLMDVKAFKPHFTGSLSHEPTDQDHRGNGISMDDWMRGLVWLLCLKRLFNRNLKRHLQWKAEQVNGGEGSSTAAARADTGARGGEKDDQGADDDDFEITDEFVKYVTQPSLCGVRAATKLPAQLPTYATDAEMAFRAADSKDDQVVKVVAADLKVFDKISALGKRFTKTQTDLRTAEMKQKGCEAMVFQNARLSAALDEVNEPKPNTQTVRSLLQSVGRLAKVTHGEDSMKFSGPDTPYAEELETQSAQGNLAAIGADVSAGELGNDHLVGELHQDPDGEDRPLNDQDLSDIRKVLLECNARQGPTPDLEQSLKLLRFHGNDMLVATDSDGSKMPWRYMLHGIATHPWQTIAIAWILLKFYSPGRTALLSDDTGLGKTYTAILSFLEFNRRAAYRFETRDKILAGTIDSDENVTDDDIGSEEVAGAKEVLSYTPTLVVAPAQALLVWKTALQSMKLEFKIFMGSEDRASAADKNRMLDDNAQVQRYLDSKPKDDPKSAQCFVLTSYETWATRTPVLRSLGVERDGEKPTNVRYDPVTPKPVRLTKIQSEGLTTDQKRELVKGLRLEAEIEAEGENARRREAAVESAAPSEVVADYSSRFEGCFNGAILDEGHKIRNPDTRNHWTILKVKIKNILILTASPLIDRVEDLRGIMTFFWDKLASSAVKELNPEDGDIGEQYSKHLPRLTADFTACNGETPTLNHLLNPDTFHQLFKDNRSLKSKLADQVLPTVMAMMSLRRVAGQGLRMPDGSEITIGGNIPPFTVTTVELATTPQHRLMIAKASRGLSEAAKASKGDTDDKDIRNTIGVWADGEEDDGLQDIRGLRRMSHVVFNGALDTMMRKGVDISADSVAKWNLNNKVHRDYFFWHIVNAPPHLLPGEDRLAHATFVAGLSPKLQLLLRLIDIIVFLKKEVVLVYANWPLEIWNTLLLLKCVGVDAASVRYGQSTSEREDAILSFTTGGCKVLVCSSRAAATSFNFQACHHTIIMDPVSVMIINQIIGRCYRLGQLYRQYIWILTINGTVDAALSHRAALKHIAMLRGSTPMTVEQGEVLEAMNNPDFSEAICAHFKRDLVEDIEDEEELYAYVEELIKQERAIEMHRILLGQKESRGRKSWFVGQNEEIKQTENLAWTQELDEIATEELGKRPIDMVKESDFMDVDDEPLDVEYDDDPEIYASDSDDQPLDQDSDRPELPADDSFPSFDPNTDPPRPKTGSVPSVPPTNKTDADRMDLDFAGPMDLDFADLPVMARASGQNTGTASADPSVRPEFQASRADPDAHDIPSSSQPAVSTPTPGDPQSRKSTPLSDVEDDTIVAPVSPEPAPGARRPSPGTTEIVSCKHKCKNKYRCGHSCCKIGLANSGSDDDDD
ncbi:Hypothetical protein D9617_88g007500 [Elsinoe fawcettii]|nr:Hypothetical protein D9617_88g007500 [Elsinoe fawcettii]